MMWLRRFLGGEKVLFPVPSDTHHPPPITEPHDFTASDALRDAIVKDRDARRRVHANNMDMARAVAEADKIASEARSGDPKDFIIDSLGLQLADVKARLAVFLNNSEMADKVAEGKAAEAEARRLEIVTHSGSQCTEHLQKEITDLKLLNETLREQIALVGANAYRTVRACVIEELAAEAKAAKRKTVRKKSPTKKK